MRFSERYGYVKPVDVLKRGGLDQDGITALCNCYDQLYVWLNEHDVDDGFHHDESYVEMEEMIWCYFLNQRRNDFYYHNSHKVVSTEYILSSSHEWYLKLDLIEFSIKVLRSICRQGDVRFDKIINAFVQSLNLTFERLNYGYKVVNDQIVEITDEKEIKAIENAIRQTSAVGLHLNNAMILMSERPSPDYRNSIKESISAVEALCRDITGETTLGPALKNLENSGLIIPSSIKTAIEKLYVYTNDSKTGIRHALMDDAAIPMYDEANFMLVTCSAFINYIQGKRSNSIGNNS